MKYFFDTEFIEGTQEKIIGTTRPTIDLISIGMVDENDREYYAVSNDFNLKEAWNRYDIKHDHGKPQGLGDAKVYWIRENILLPIFNEFYITAFDTKIPPFCYESMETLLSRIGKPNKQIAYEILQFIGNYTRYNPEFYAYYASYDWVVFCWLFGKMIDLPRGFPMYCKDLKQMMDDKGLTKEWKRINCPDPIGEHNALIDAKWNISLYRKLVEINN
jgi:hypothetical protein